MSGNAMVTSVGIVVTVFVPLICPRFRVQSIANTAWGLTTSNHASRNLMERLAMRAYAIRDTFPPQELSMWFLSVMPFSRRWLS